MQVLVVDDDDEIRTLVSELLADEGYGVREAAHGREALSLLEGDEAELPSVILLDLMMPVMDGREVLERLAASERLRAIPVIITTAAPDQAEGRTFAALVRKPFEIEALLEEIRRHDGRTG
jgi:CheY-like chemotaxis protein